MKFTACWHKQTEKSQPRPVTLPFFLGFRHFLMNRNFSFFSLRNFDTPIENIPVQDWRWCYKLPLPRSIIWGRNLFTCFIWLWCTFGSYSTNKICFLWSCITYTCSSTTYRTATPLARATAITPRRWECLKAAFAATTATPLAQWSRQRVKSFVTWTREIMRHKSAIGKQMISWGIWWCTWFHDSAKLEFQAKIIFKSLLILCKFANPLQKGCKIKYNFLHWFFE